MKDLNTAEVAEFASKQPGVPISAANHFFNKISGRPDLFLEENFPQLESAVLNFIKQNSNIEVSEDQTSVGLTRHGIVNRLADQHGLSFSKRWGLLESVTDLSNEKLSETAVENNPYRDSLEYSDEQLKRVHAYEIRNSENGSATRKFRDDAIRKIILIETAASERGVVLPKFDDSDKTREDTTFSKVVNLFIGRKVKDTESGFKPKIKIEPKAEDVVFTIAQETPATEIAPEVVLEQVQVQSPESTKDVTAGLTYRPYTGIRDILKEKMRENKSGFVFDPENFLETAVTETTISENKINTITPEITSEIREREFQSAERTLEKFGVDGVERIIESLKTQTHPMYIAQREALEKIFARENADKPEPLFSLYIQEHHVNVAASWPESFQEGKIFEQAPSKLSRYFDPVMSLFHAEDFPKPGEQFWNEIHLPNYKAPKRSVENEDQILVDAYNSLGISRLVIENSQRYKMLTQAGDSSERVYGFLEREARLYPQDARKKGLFTDYARDIIASEAVGELAQQFAETEDISYLTKRAEIIRETLRKDLENGNKENLIKLLPMRAVFLKAIQIQNSAEVDDSEAYKEGGF